MRYERISYDASDPHSSGVALICKSHCYALCGLYSESANTLDRVDMSALSPQERNDLLMEKAVCSALSGDFGATKNICEELSAAGNSEYDENLRGIFLETISFLEKNAPALKSEKKALILSFLPPFGHIYTGRTGEGLLRMAADAAAVSIGVLEAVAGNWVTAFLSCSIGLYESFWKGNAHIQEDIENINDAAQKAVAKSLEEHICGDFREWLGESL